MKRKIRHIMYWCKTKIDTITPGKNAVQGAAIALFSITGILWLLYASLIAINFYDPWILLLFLGFALAALLSSLLTIRLIRRLTKIPRVFMLAILIMFPLLFMMSFGWLLPICIMILT